MTKTNKIRSAFAALALACAILPAVAAWNSGSFSKPAPAPVAAEGAPAPKPAPVAEEAPAVVELAEVVITAKPHAKAAPVAKKAQKSQGCRLHALEQGGRPGAPFVLVCG